MRIRQLELIGFKSFKKRTVIRFSEGINGIVGPNGCGKSNIMDAFLWVMGESAPSHLRGSSMEDVIFTGAGSLPPSGSAEVSLVLEKTKDGLWPSYYKNFSDLMLTRRLDREGKSEYLLNSKPCRLKDIQDIFIDTGAGPQGFSFIEQSAVERFLSSKPEQKRRLIESTAGILRFRTKKKSAEKKLQLTQNNLQRLKDFLSEQSSQLAKLKRQAEKSTAFKQLKEDIKNKDLQISEWDLRLLQKKTEDLKANLEQKTKTLSEDKKQLSEWKSSLTQLKESYEDKKQSASDTALELKVQTLKKMLSDFDQNTNLSNKFIQSVEEQIRELSENEKEQKNLLKTKNQEIERLKTKQSRLRGQLEKEKQMSFNVSHLTSALTEEAGRLKKNILEKEKHYEEVRQKTSALQMEWESCKRWGSCLTDGEKGMEQVLAKYKDSFTSAAEAFRLNDPVLEEQVSAFLEFRLKSLFCSKEAALSAVEGLKKEGLSRLKFIIKDFQKIEKNNQEEQIIKNENGFEFFLKSKITGPADLIECLFSKTAVVSDLSSALRLKKNHPSWCFISLTGEVLTAEGDLMAGLPPSKEVNILEYKRTMNEMPSACKKLEEQSTLLSKELNTMRSSLENKLNTLSSLRKKKGGGEVSVFGLKKDMEMADKDIVRLDKEILHLNQKIKTCQEKLKNCYDKKDNLSYQENSHQKPSMEKELDRAEKELSARVKAGFKNSNLSSSALKQKEQALNTQCEKMNQDIDSLQTNIIQLHQKLSSVEGEINEIKLNQENVTLKQGALADRIKELYEVNLRNCLAEDDKKTDEEDFNRQKEEEQLQKMNSRLSRMGAVNLLALQEKETLEESRAFYQKQYEDLCASQEKLTEAIKKIDSFCSEKFKKVFDQVNDCFSRIFPALFEGGKAEMILTAGEDSEEGVEVMVQPPEKKIQNMNLLSGGEKAMTASALIFSIFMVKPSPFCVLDEVDAPLDDVNTARFNSLLKEMSSLSQVIIITHNKHTMGRCDQLYGVTMQEKGVSQIMSLDMKKYSAGAEDFA